MEDWQKLHDRLDRAHRDYIQCHFGLRDLWIMHRAVYEKLREADREWVNCRRRGQASELFNRLMAQAEESLKSFEGHILIAKLKQKDHHERDN